MAKLYTLMGGVSKKRMKRLMTDLENKVINYRDALKKTPQTKYKHFEVRPATEDEGVYRKNSSSQWTNYNRPEPKYSKVKVDIRG